MPAGEELAWRQGLTGLLVRSCTSPPGDLAVGQRYLQFGDASLGDLSIGTVEPRQPLEPPKFRQPQGIRDAT